jgi:cyanoexosortase B-associated protein
MAGQTKHTPSTTFPTSWIKAALVIALTVLACVAILPAYLTGQWPWITAPQVEQMEQLNDLAVEGIEIPGWSRQSHQTIAINGKDWSFGEYIADSTGANAPAIDQMGLLMLPQSWHSDQPEVEWVDLQGAQHWKLSSCRKVAIVLLTSAQNPADFTARLCRAATDQQTLVLLQWYAWPTGGHPAPSRWFWVNQRSQFRHYTLTPWVAVTVLVPINPLADLSDYQAQISALASRVQQQVTMAIDGDTA